MLEKMAVKNVINEGKEEVNNPWAKRGRKLYDDIVK